MKPSLEMLRFSRPLREVRLVNRAAGGPTAQEVLEREESAYDRGRREGEKSLSQQLLRQRSELLELQNGVLDSLRQLLPQVARECEQALVALALEAARKLVSGLPLSAELVEAAVREALASVQDTAEFTVELNAADLELLQRANSPVLLTEVGGERVHFRPSDEVSRGGCIVQTAFGVLDGRRETKLQLLRRALEVA